MLDEIASLPTNTNSQELFGGSTPSLTEQAKSIDINTNNNISISQTMTSLFPKSLESSGYVILSGVALIFCLFIILFIFKIQNAISITQKNTNTLKEVMVSLFVNQQSLEYKILLDEFNKADNSTDKLNAKTQLWNFLNKISREICESKDEFFAINLGIAFFSKIQGRYLKMGTTPDGIIYFKAIGDLLIKYSEHLSGKLLTKKIRSEYKRNVVAQQKLAKEISKE